MSKKSEEEANDINFSESFSKLEKITEKFEQEEFDLDEGIEKFEEGIKMANELKNELQEAENKVEEIKQNFAEE